MQNDGKDLHPRSGQGPLHQHPQPNHRPAGPSAVPQLSKPAHLLSADDVVRELATNPDDGLTADDAQARLAAAGPNELEGGGGISPLRILAGQIFNAMVLVGLLPCGFTALPG